MCIKKGGYMFPSLPSTIDSLTSGGVIDFDAESYIKGVPPRYIGAPKTYLPFEQPLPGYVVPNLGAPAKLHEQPHKDELVKEQKTPSWKKLLAGLLAASLVIFAGYKLKQKGTKAVEAVKNTPKTVAGWFKGKAKTQQAGAAASEAVNKTKGIFARTKDKIVGLPKWAKITGGIAAGLLASYGAIKVFFNSKVPSPQPEHPPAINPHPARH